MNRRQVFFACGFGCLVLITSTVSLSCDSSNKRRIGREFVNDRTWDTLSVWRDSTKPFSVRIVPTGIYWPFESNEIVIYGNTYKFYVVVENVSGIPQSIYKESNSWGYYNLWLTFTDETGQLIRLHKKSSAWGSNGPEHVLISPGQVVAFEIGDTSVWDFSRFNRPIRKKAYLVQAFYQNNPQDTTVKMACSSEPKRFLLSIK